MPQPPINLAQLLRLKHYDPQEILERGIESDVGLTPGQIASVLMVSCHLDLAVAMVKQGVVPEEIPAKGMPSRRYWGEQCTGYYPLGIAFLMSNDIKLFEKSLVDPGASARETLEYLLDHQDTWLVGLNKVAGTLTLLNHVPNGYNADTHAVRDHILTAFLNAGADINVQSDTQNAIKNAAFAFLDRDPSYYEGKNFDWSAHNILVAQNTQHAYEKILALGFDKTVNPHIALSAAILADHDHTHTQTNASGAQFGIRGELLVGMGFEITSPTDCPAEVNPFHVAITRGQPRSVQRLLDAGCDPAWIDPTTGDTLFALAASGKPYMVDALDVIPNEQLARVANHRNKKGDTPFHQAVASLSLPLVKKLVSCGADINATNKKGKLPLQMVRKNGAAAKQQLQDIIEFLNSVGVAVAPHEIPGVLHQACKALAHETVQLLITQGARVDSLDNQGRTPLIVLAQNAKVNYYDDERQQVARKSYETIVDSLLDAGACIDDCDKQGNTPLHHAVAVASPIMVGVLLRLGADMNASNKKGLVPSHMWEDKHYGDGDKEALKIIQLFSSHGFDPEHEGPNGELPFSKLRHTDQFRAAHDEWSLRKNTQLVATHPTAKTRL
jgi:ankyrin repeat protein